MNPPLMQVDFFLKEIQLAGLIAIINYNLGIHNYVAIIAMCTLTDIALYNIIIILVKLHKMI